MWIFFYQLLFGIIASSIVAFFSYLLKLLTPSGALASVLLGSLVIAMGPWFAILLVGLVFVSSGVIQLFKKWRHFSYDSSMIAKTGQRDQQQVLANTLPALFALFFYSITHDVVFLIAFASCLAGACADTWASEVGVLSQKPPRSLLNLKLLPKGQSGGVSLLGSGATIFGAAFISFSFYFFIFLSHQFQQPPLEYFFIPLVAGIFTSFMDSLLGATIQALYQCVVCGKRTEKEIHHDQPTKLVKGYQWANNDMINFLSGIMTVFLSLLLTVYF